MILAVFGSDEQWVEFKKDSCNADLVRLYSLTNIPMTIEAVFIIADDVMVDFDTITIPVFINSVSNPLKELNAPVNVLRINGWRGFLERPNWEIAGTINNKVVTILAALNKDFTKVADEAGFIAARVLAMIINEAWFALGEKISTKAEIDIAMKLGTNYPYGPFEWSELIGEKNIFTLLKKLSSKDKRYLPAPLLVEKMSK
jgi:3-hydroxybutyryl-CoA dehydrogenase